MTMTMTDVAAATTPSDSSGHSAFEWKRWNSWKTWGHKPNWHEGNHGRPGFGGGHHPWRPRPPAADPTPVAPTAVPELSGEGAIGSAFLLAGLALVATGTRRRRATTAHGHAQS
jgi:hypothetical protein